MGQQTNLEPLVSSFADDPDMADLVEMFVDELPQRIDSLRSLFDQQQFQDLETMAHQIKGAGGGYGYPSLTEAARKLENTLKKQNNLHGVQTALEELIQLCTRACLNSG